MIMTNLDEPFILKLSKPVTLGNVSYETLTLREPTAEDVEKASGVANPATSNILLISAVADVPAVFIRKISHRDLKRAVKYLENFTADGPETGES
jgi:Phage tail assembly chaperone proteins, E, or 41 or 14